MTQDATPVQKKPGRPARGPKYPAQLAFVVSEDMRARIDAEITETGATLGEVARALISDGFAYQDRPER